MSVLNIGDVTFGLIVQTDGMRKAQDALNAFGSQVDAAAQSQVEGSQAVARALNAQEKAARSAIIQTTELQVALRAAGASPIQLGAATAAFNNLNKVMTSGQLGVVEFTRAQDKFKMQIGQVAQALKTIPEPNDKVKGFSEVLKDLQSSAVLAVGPLSGIGARITALNSIATRSTAGIVALVAGFVATGVAAYSLASGALSASLEMQKINAALTVATGSSQQAQQEFKFVSDESNRLGINLASAAEEYSKLAGATRGSTLAGKETRDIFSAIAETSRTLGLSAEQTSGIMKAFTDMISMGTVRSQELKAQLGNNLPGALSLAAAAMGKTTQELLKMVETGKLLTSDFLPKMVNQMHLAFGDSAQKLAGGLAGSIERLHNSTLLFSVAFDSATGISTKFASALTGVSSLIDAITRNMPTITGAVVALVGAVTGFVASWALLNFGTIIAGFTSVLTAVRSLTAAMALLDILTTANVITGLIKIVAVVGGAAIAWYEYNKAVTAVTASQALQIKSTNDFITQQDKVHSAAKDVVQAKMDEARANLVIADTALMAVQAQMEGATLWQQFQNAADITGARQESLNAQFQTQVDLVAKYRAQVAALQTTLSNAPLLANNNTPLINEKNIRKADDLLTKVQEHIDALNKGPKAVEDFTRWKEKQTELESYRRTLEASGLTQDQVNAKVSTFSTLLDQQSDAEKRYNDVTKKLADAADEFFSQTESDLLSLRDGTLKVAGFFDNMVNNIINSLMKLVLEEQVVRPLKDVLSGVLGTVASALFPSFGSSASSAGGGLLSAGGTPSAGNAVDLSTTNLGGTVAGRASGGNMTSGTPYRVFDGKTDQVELFVPRSSGNMVANPQLGGGPVQIIINNNTNSQVTATPTSNGGAQINIGDMMAAEINKPGSKVAGAIKNVVGRGNTGR